MGESLNVTSGRWSRGLLLVALAALGLWLWAAVPLAMGWRTLYFRDVFTTHLPVKAFGAAELRAGRIPAFNPGWGLGQPFRGNPNPPAFLPGDLALSVPAVLERLQPPLRPPLASRGARHGRPGPRAGAGAGGGAHGRRHVRRIG